MYIYMKWYQLLVFLIYTYIAFHKCFTIIMLPVMYECATHLHFFNLYHFLLTSTSPPEDLFPLLTPDTQPENCCSLWCFALRHPQHPSHLCCTPSSLSEGNCELRGMILQVTWWENISLMWNMFTKQLPVACFLPTDDYVVLFLQLLWPRPSLTISLYSRETF